MNQQNWPATKIEMRPIDALINYARNSRKHSDAQIDKVAASIREFGWTIPILIDEDNTIIAGHCRVLSAKKLNITEVPVMVAKGWSEAQRRAYVISDNQLTLLGEWNEDILKLELMDLKANDFDLGLTGFDSKELDLLLKDEPVITESEGDTEPEIDRADELRNKWDVEYGQLWKLGRHWLLCGDSTNVDDVKRLMNGNKADLCFTSPPYGQQRNYRDEATKKVVDWDTLMQGVFANLPMKETGQVFVNLGMIHEGEWIPYWENWIQWMREQGWKRFGWYVWDQGHGFAGDFGGRCAPSFEFIFHFNKVAQPIKKTIETRLPGKKNRKVQMGADGPNYSDGYYETNSHKIQDSVWRVPRGIDRSIEHPAKFHIDLPSIAINSWESNLIYEPFSGSGTTLIASENLNRICYAMEISPSYCAVAIERFYQHTNQEPIKA